MDNNDNIMNMAMKNNGIVTTQMVVNAGFLRGSLKHLADSGKLERVSRGVYILPSAWEDEFLNLQIRFKRGIFSCETALFLWDLTDRTPNFYHMTFPTGYNLTTAKAENIRCSQAKESIYSLGVVQLKSPNGNTVQAYNMEHTLCDLLRGHNNVDIQVISDAFKRYIQRKDKNIPLLSEYAKLMRVEKRLRGYLEVLM